MNTALQTEWWQTYFDPDWIKIFAYKNREAGREARAIVKLLGLPRGGRILDIGCGNGRVSIALARLGYRVTGMDYSGSLLEEAQKKATRAGLDIEWVQADMREIGITNRFDAVVNLFSSFGYFTNEDEDVKTLQSAAKALKQDGKIIIDLENIFFISRAALLYGRQTLYRPIEDHRGWVEEITDFNPADQRVYMDLRLWLPGFDKPKSAKVSYRAYTLMELKSLLAKAGLVCHSVYGDFSLSPYETDSERMIVLGVPLFSKQQG